MKSSLKIGLWALWLIAIPVAAYIGFFLEFRCIDPNNASCQNGGIPYEIVFPAIVISLPFWKYLFKFFDF